MFTVRWKIIHSSEVVFQAAYLNAQTTWADDPRGGKGDVIALEFYNADHSEAREPIFFGDVYVMNEQGRTVADYHLVRPIDAAALKTCALDEQRTEVYPIRVGDRRA